MKGLYLEFANDEGTVYYGHIGTFVLWLRDKGWMVVDSCDSGSRTADYWIIQSPAGDFVHIWSWLDGDVQMKTPGGLSLMNTEEYKSICNRVAKYRGEI